MALIYESDNFTVEAVDKPLVDRNDGGHISINPKRRVKDRQALSAVEAIELMRLTMTTGEAMTTIMNEHGVDVKRINYQDNGNWGVLLPKDLTYTFTCMAGQQAPNIISMDKPVIFLTAMKTPHIMKTSNL